MAGKRALITGITGQDGSYLAELLLEKGYEVHGMVRRSSTETFQRLEHIPRRADAPHRGPARPALARATCCAASSRTRSTTSPRCRSSRPPGPSRCSPRSSPRVGVTRLLEAMREVAPDARFYQASSSEMFGKVREVPQTETTPFYPRSPYGVAKCYGHFITVNYRESYGLFAAPGSSSTTSPSAAGSSSSRARSRTPRPAIKLGLQDELALGNLDAERDWGYAKRLRRGDVADAPAGRARRLRDRDGRDAQRPRARGAWRSTTSGSTRTSTCASTSASCGRPRWSTWSATPRRRSERLGWEPRTSFEELVRPDGGRRPRAARARGAGEAGGLGRGRGRRLRHRRQRVRRPAPRSRSSGDRSRRAAARRARPARRRRGAHARGAARGRMVFHLAALASRGALVGGARRGHAREPGDDRQRARGGAPRGAGRRRPARARARSTARRRTCRSRSAPLRPQNPYAVSKAAATCSAGSTRTPTACAWCARGRSTTPDRASRTSTWSARSPARSPRRRSRAATRCCEPGTPTSRATSPTCVTWCARTWPRATGPGRVQRRAAEARSA